MTNRAGEVPRGEPLAYFLTWPTYGTWLPGDERGWVKWHRGFQPPDAVKKLEAAARMAENACRLDRDERRLVETAIVACCGVRGWALHAVNCRSNHVHVVVTARVDPDTVREQLKAWCSRRLMEAAQNRGGSVSRDGSVRTNWWAERGSQRYLNDEDSLEAAILYVRDAQDTVP